MKLAICLIGEDSLALASLKQQLEKEASVSMEPRICNYGEAFDGLKNRNGPVVAVVDINRDPERAFAVAEQIKLRLTNVRLVMTSPTGAPDTILRAMRSGAEEFLTQPFNWAEVLKSLDTIRKKVDVHPAKGSERGHIIASVEHHRIDVLAERWLGLDLALPRLGDVHEPPRVRAHEHEIRDVRAGDQQHSTDRTHEHPQHPRHAADQVVV